MNKSLFKRRPPTIKDMIVKETSAGSETKVIEFKIAGVPYKIKTSQVNNLNQKNMSDGVTHDQQALNELIQYVDAKVSEALKITKNSSFQNAAVLACLNIAEEMMIIRKKAYSDLAKLENKAIKLYLDLENTKTHINLPDVENSKVTAEL